MAQPKSVTAVVSGRVQGVGFRWRCIQQAEALGVCGWVLNRPDGRVEVHLEGAGELVDDFLDWVRSSPGYAHVEQVGVSPAADESCRRFEAL